jgi:CRISPR/Cas system-associated endonuclease/helicase Cas3
LIHDGGTVAIVLNTVAQVTEMYLYARNQCDCMGLDIDLNLLHSRFPLEQKNQKTQDILKKYGKDRSHRPLKSILISTQIIEQSLDVDFDYMITEIAPIDLIEQRFGRIRRHSDGGTIRETKTMSGPSAFVFYIENGFGKSGYVYEKSLLSATRDFLSKGKILESPKDVRESIETVYLEENVNRLKAIRQSQQADMVSIGKVNCKDFWRFVQLTSLRNDSHTRQEGMPSTNIILISDDQQRRFENGEPLSSIELREIVKTQMYSSVPIKKLDGIERIETNNPYLDEYRIYNKSQFQVSDELGLQL